MTHSPSGSEERLNKLLKELQKRAGALSLAFEKQKEAIEHGSRRKVLDLPRRSAKTYSCMLDAFHDQRTHPNSKYAYIALTRPSAENIAWPVAREIDRTLELGCHFQEAKLRVTFPNGATMQLFGADQKEWGERLRGAKYRRLYIHEAAFYRVNMKRLIEEILEPALMDEDGTLWLVGSPGDIVPASITQEDIAMGRFYFYCAAIGKIAGWQRFKWTPEDNPYMREQYIAKMAEKRALNPDIDKDPGFRREYLGEWVAFSLPPKEKRPSHPEYWITG